MPSTRDIKRIVVGGVEAKRMMVGGQVVWPKAYLAFLTIDYYEMGGNYTIDKIPAAGGSAIPRYRFTIQREYGGQTVFSDYVTPTSFTLSEEVGGQWVTATNFSFLNGVWTANDRARNGVQEGEIPQSAPARRSRLSASYSMVYQGVTVSASCAPIMTQNANKVELVSSPYVNLQVTLDRYGSGGAEAAPAYETSNAKVSATYDQQFNYQFYDDGGTARVDGLTYQRTVAEAVTSESFNFTSSESWVTFLGQDSSGATVRVAGRGYDLTAERNATITATYTGSGASQTSDTVTLYQSRNAKTEIGRVTTGFYFYLLQNSITAAQTTIGFRGVADYNVTYSWASLAPNTTEAESEYQTPDRVVQLSGATAQINLANEEITIPENQGFVAREFEFRGYYGSFYYDDSVSQDASADYDFRNPTVELDYEVIGAAALTGFPMVNVEQKVYVGGEIFDTLRGFVDGGATTGTISGNRLSATFTINSFSGSPVSGTGASINTATGGVTTASRGTTAGPERDVVRNIYASVTVDNGKNGTNAEAATARQSANVAYPVDALQIGVTIASLSTYSVNTCARTAVTATVRGTWYDAGVEYTALYDGDSSAYTGMAYHENEVINGSNGVTMLVDYTDEYSNSENRFYVDNRYSESQASYDIVAEFGYKRSEPVTVTQAADSKSGWKTKDYECSVSLGDDDGIWAGGGYAVVTATAEHTQYKTWQDGTPVDSSQVTDTPTLSVVRESGTPDGAFSITTVSGETRLVHRDMQNNGVTDAAHVHAVNGSASDDTNSVSITNSRSTTPDGYGSYSADGSRYNGNYGIDSFSVTRYTSASAAAPSAGGTTPFSVVASHDILQMFSRDVYYYYDSNWASQHGGTDHNDATHRYTEVKGDSEERIMQSGITGDPVAFEYDWGVDWISVSGNNLVIAAQTSGSPARDSRVFVFNNGAGTPQGFPLNVRIYQYAYAALSVSPTSLAYPAAGGTRTIEISWAYTRWELNYRPTITQPELSFSANSGGNASSSGTTTVVVTAAPASSFLDDGDGGIIHIEAVDGDVPDATVTVLQSET